MNPVERAVDDLLAVDRELVCQLKPPPRDWSVAVGMLIVLELRRIAAALEERAL